MFSNTSETIPCFRFMKNKVCLDTLPAVSLLPNGGLFSANWRFTQ